RRADRASRLCLRVAGRRSERGRSRHPEQGSPRAGEWGPLLRMTGSFAALRMTVDVDVVSCPRKELKMTQKIRRAAVLGAGVMGAQIAAHLAAAGVRTWLLDLASTEEPKDKAVAKAVGKNYRST